MEEELAFDATLGFLDAYAADELTLEGVLCLLSDLEDQSDAHEPPTSQVVLVSSSQAADGATKAKRKRQNHNSNKARDERRVELLRLRTAVEQLEGLRSHLQKRLSVAQSSRPTLASGVLSAPRVWEEIATRQLTERRRAEEENAQLKIVLADQTRLSRSLEKLVNKRSTMQSFEACGLTTCKRMYINPDQRKDPVVYAELSEMVDAGYCELDAVFERGGISNMEQSFRDVQLHESERGPYLEVYQNKILPVSCHVAGDAVWRHFAQSMARIPFRQYYERTTEPIEGTQDTVVESIGLELHAHNITVDFNLLQVLRHYTEDDRDVIIWSARVYPITFAGTPVDGLLFRERGYMMFKKPQSLDPQEYTILKMCHSFKPDFSPDAVHQDQEFVKKLTEYVLMDGIALSTGTHQVIENMLLREAMRRRGGV
ncbi:hypothetical protein Poli38472_000479 [Pythium oligandrum]|uniref:Uncharacterized protein n=1 Tax=Pythium oligandrum TaxID=41045 RepID=A0A8K1FI55_PYTOL|nr:hypothetical protein Poli38472_000479 [Pythium oligandrum]|eukprot:TMW60437.1 hypothetical protein Poli38472_000479 [Pythium oligandrum]